MKTVIIKYFNTHQQNRITLLRLLTEYTNWGLKKSKDNMDSMVLDNEPIICEIEDLKVDSFTNELINLKLEFEIK